VVALIAAALLGTARRSRAQVAEPEELRSERLEREFTLLAADERAHRTLRDGAALTFGAGAIAGGIVLINQDNGSIGAYAVTAIGGARFLAAGYDILWGRGRFEALAATIADMRRMQLPEPEILRRTDFYWRQEADRARAARLWVGGLESVIGTLLVGTGVLIAIDENIGMSPSDRTVRAGSLVALGSLLAAVGAGDLILRDPVEVGYGIFRTNKEHLGDLSSKRSTFTFGLGGPGIAAATTF
jgi:hypothetical protein